MVKTLRPTSLDEISQAVRSSPSVRIVGLDGQEFWRLPGRQTETLLDMSGYKGIIDFSPKDQVVVVRAGTSIGWLNEQLAEHGQCIPLVEWCDGYSPLNVRESVGGGLSMNLPQYLDAECGTWRDWVLGLTVVLADGRVARSGSQAVKNVAGYDVHKLFIGARGTLGVVADVILRTYPLKSLPEPQVRGGRRPSHPDVAEIWVQRTRPCDFTRAVEASAAYSGWWSEPSSTLWLRVPPDAELLRFPGDWVIRGGCGEQNLRIEDPVLAQYMRRTKNIFDPEAKLNPGEMGIF